jgi:hypothetical protein
VRQNKKPLDDSADLISFNMVRGCHFLTPKEPPKIGAVGCRLRWDLGDH